MEVLADYRCTPPSTHSQACHTSNPDVVLRFQGFLFLSGVADCSLRPGLLRCPAFASQRLSRLLRSVLLAGDMHKALVCQHKRQKLLGTPGKCCVMLYCRLSPAEAEAQGRESVAVAVRSKHLLATAFHPELTDDLRWCANSVASRGCPDPNTGCKASCAPAGFG